MKHPRRRLEDELHEVWNDWINDNDYGLWHDVPEVGALGAAAVAVGAAAPDNDAPGEMLDGDEFPIVLAAGGRAADPGEGVPRRAAPPAALPVATSRRAASRRQQSLLETASAALQSAAGTVTSAARSAADFGVRLQGGLNGAKAAAVAGAHRYLKPIVRPILELNGLGGMLPPSRSASVAQAARAASRSMSVAPAARAASRPLTAAGTGLVPPPSRAPSRAPLAAPNAGGGAPSLDGLRLNAGGRVVNAQGRFVSQDVAALYLQRNPAAT